MPSASTEQSDLRRRGRHRLIGAVTIALVAAVVIPMVLDAEPKRAPPPAELAIPSRDAVSPLPPPELPAQPSVSGAVASAAPEAAPVVPPPAPDSGAVAEAAKAPPVAARPNVASVTEATPIAPAAKAPTAEKSETPPKASPALVGFAVQAGAFRDEAKLAQARKKLVAAGLSHYSERLAGQGGEITRLRAGPFATREAAVAAAAKMKAAGLEAAVVALP